eukprot:TRINITY_DN2478_c0_g1_i2.p1 TRINITY_DN2478_c0_g1~~TRINITY_DN2478_c0_g1_i2.p1  ORF type:complete len:1086 (-),score=51.15 TRINITY_DN2478_c0_g1_i2:201-3152(-)
MYAIGTIVILMRTALSRRTNSAREPDSKSKQAATSLDSDAQKGVREGTVLDSEKQQSCQHGPPINLLLVSDVVAQHRIERPDSTALTYRLNGNRAELTYSSFWKHVEWFQHRLDAQEVRAGSFVVMCVDRGLHQVVAIYAMLASGVVWTPVDTSSPASRITHILDETKAVLLLYQAECQEAVLSANKSKVQSMELREDSFVMTEEQVKTGTAPVCPSLQLDQTALVFYTSGSTGLPKGVIYSHSHVAHVATTLADDLRYDVDSVGLYKTPYIWAVMAYELFPALMRGGRLVVADAQGHKDPLYLASLIKTEKVSVFLSTSKVIDILLNVHDEGGELDSLEHVVNVGEALPVSTANRFLETSGIRAKLHNMYGATESGTTLITVPSGGIHDAKSKFVPAGTAQGGVSVYILDECGRPVESGLGEICFGWHLADGYWANPSLTEEKFRTHSDLGRLYHTGDRGYFSGGILHVCGRADRQVKIKGVRIELEEVEAVIAQCKAGLSLSGSAAVATEPDESAELVAIIAPSVSQAVVEQVRIHCKASLPPAYMPSRILSLPEIPLLNNGKTDLTALKRIASEYCQSSEVEEIVDSLGLMKKMSKDDIQEVNVIHRCYTLWMFGVIVGHWYSCGIGVEVPYCIELLDIGVNPTLELFYKTISNDQTMFGFILLGAWQDSMRRCISLGAQDAVLLYAYVGTAFLLGPFLETLAPSVFQDVRPYHSWYLLMVLWARFSTRILQAMSVPSLMQVVLHVALAVFGPATALHLPGAWGMKLAPYGGYLYLSWFQCYTATYVAAFHYVRAIVGFFKPKIASLRFNSTHALASFCLSVAIGAVWTHVHYPSLNFNFSDYVRHHPDVRIWLLPETIVPCLICALQVFSMAWCPVSFRWSGGATLGTYLTHFYAIHPDSSKFGPMLLRGFAIHPDASKSFLPHVFQELLQESVSLQVLLITAWPLFFTFVIGPLLHHVLIVAPQSCARSLWSACAAPK